MSNPELRKMTGTRGIPTREGHHHWFLNRVNDEDNITYVIICNQKPVGIIGTIDYDKVFLNAGIYLYLGNVKDRSKGIGQTAIKMFSEFLFHECGLHKINAWIFSYNKKSMYAFEKCGYRLEGVQKEQVFVCDEEKKYYDKLLYGLINQQ
ncbi:MAG: GNAT family N-acetyltransferase [Ruminococcus flavefaciens]|nr:GNAT family N-acetyltransferase [Ruminococcus flavefaciens]